MKEPNTYLRLFLKITVDPLVDFIYLLKTYI